MKKNCFLLLVALLTLNSLFAQINLISFNDTWKYLDDGSDQATAWQNLSFSDASWKSGTGKFGYGIPDANTIVSFGPNSKNKYITTYFRKAINLANPAAYPSYTAHIHRDDGAIVYVNGVEVYRNNMPAGTIGFDTLASGSPADDGASIQTFTISNSFFVAGNNVVAVEIHQHSVSSSDIAFDLNLTTPDQTPPAVVSINRQLPATLTSSAASVTFRLTFSEPVTGVGRTDFALTTTGTATGTIGSTALKTVDADGAVYDLTITTLTGAGTIRADLKASSTGIADLAGNVIPNGGYTAGQVYNIDRILPTVVSINRQSPVTATTSNTSLSYRVTFSEPVSGVDLPDFTLTTVSGTAAGTLAANAVVPVGTQGTVYDVTATSITGAGVLRLDVNASGTAIADTAGNVFAAGFTTGQTYNVDRIAPSVSSINLQNPSSVNTSASTVTFRVTFSEPISGVDANDFAVTGTVNGILVSNAVASVGTDGTTYDVTVSGISGSGTLRLDLNGAGTGITDAVGNAISAGFTSGQTYTIDQTPPSVTSILRQSPSEDHTTLNSVVFRVSFSEPVTGVDQTDFSVTTTGTATGALSANAVVTVGTNGMVYDVSVNGVTGTGTIRLDLNANGTGITDAVGNPISTGYTAGQTYSLEPADQIPPTVVSISRQSPLTENTSANAVTYRITFSEAVTGVNAVDFILTAVNGTVSGTLAANAVVMVGTDGTTYDVTASSLSSNGTLRLDLKSSGTGISDLTGNPLSQGFTSGETYIIQDLTGPSALNIDRQSPAGQFTSSSSLTFRVTFSESVTGVNAPDFSIRTINGNAGGTLAPDAVVAVGTQGVQYDVTITAVSGSGDLTLDLNTNGTGITDASGNALAAGFNTGQPYTVDHVPPSVLSINRQVPAAAITPATSVTFRIIFSEPVTGADVTDFTLATSGTASGTLPANALVAMGTDGTTYDITVTSVTGNGDIGINLNPNSGVSDLSGNVLTAGFTAGQHYTIDQPPAVMSIIRQSPASSSTSAPAVTFRVVFSEAVSGVDPSDFSLIVTGSASGILSANAVTAVGTDGTAYDVTAGTITGAGTIRLDLNANGTGITDVVGNALASGFTGGQVYTIDRVSPAVTGINRQSPALETTSATAVTFRISFSEPVNGLDPSDFTLTTTGSAAGLLAANAVSPVGTDGSTYDVTASTLSGAGTIRLDLKAAGTGITDVLGNTIAGGFNTGQTYTIDRAAPVVLSINRQSPTTSITSFTSVTFRVSFSEAVLGVDAADFALTTTGTATGVLAAGALVDVSGNGTVYDVTVTSVSGAGTIRLDLKGAGTGITDTLGNAITGGFTGGQTYTIDSAPYVMSMNRQSPVTDTTSLKTVVFRVTFSEAVTGVDVTDFILTLDPSVNATLASNAVAAVGTTGITYDVTVSSIAGSGPLRLDLKSSGTGITDAAGNAINGGFTSGQSYTIVQGTVIVSIKRQVPLTTNTTAGLVTFRLTFSQKVTGVDDHDFLVTAVSGTARGSLADLAMEPTGTKATPSVVSVGSGGNIYDVSVRALSGNGLFRLDVKASGTGIKDASGTAINTAFTSGETYNVQQTGGFATIADVAPLNMTTNTGERPMSKVWTYAGKWWAVLPVSGGTKIFRLDGTTWTAVLTAHSSSDAKADCIVVGAVTHILLFRGSSNAYLVSIEYNPATNSYKFWSQRPGAVDLGSLGSGAEAANITIDGTGRMWLAWDGTTDFKVKWSDFPYSGWSSPITVASGATTDDICAIVALPGKIGLLWSDQNAKRFGFKTHTDGASPATWSADEKPALQSAKNIGHGFGDDHLNMVCSSNGTLYCAIKTSYDIAGETKVGLLVRRPTGTWDNVYSVTSNEGTKAQVVLNEPKGMVKVIYASQTGSNGGEDIMYRESPISNISFSRPYTLLGGDMAIQYNYVTTTHQLYSNDLVIIATEVTSSPDKARTIYATETLPAVTSRSPSAATENANANRNAGQGILSTGLVAFPNPFTNHTTVSFILHETGSYSLTLHNAMGTQVAVLKQGKAEKGQVNSMALDGSRFATGIYWLQLQTATEGKRIQLVIEH